MNAISANDTALLNYLAEQQRVACRLAGVTLAIEALEMNSVASDAILPLTEIARELAQVLYLALDSASLPRPATQPTAGC